MVTGDVVAAVGGRRRAEHDKGVSPTKAKRSRRGRGVRPNFRALAGLPELTTNPKPTPAPAPTPAPVPAPAPAPEPAPVEVAHEPEMNARGVRDPMSGVFKISPAPTYPNDRVVMAIALFVGVLIPTFIWMFSTVRHRPAPHTPLVLSRISV